MSTNSLAKFSSASNSLPLLDVSHLYITLWECLPLNPNWSPNERITLCGDTRGMRQHALREPDTDPHRLLRSVATLCTRSPSAMVRTTFEVAALAARATWAVNLSGLPESPWSLLGFSLVTRSFYRTNLPPKQSSKTSQLYNPKLQELLHRDFLHSNLWN